jgi:hypothetical protein
VDPKLTRQVDGALATVADTLAAIDPTHREYSRHGPE